MKRTKYRVIIGKAEGVYGTDAAPVGADAIQVNTDLQVVPFDAEMADTDNIRGGRGNGGQVLLQRISKLSTSLDFANHGGGVIGAAPKIDWMFLACGMKGTQEYLAISAMTQVGGTATATIGAHTYKVGQIVFILGANEAAYNGQKTITAVTGTTISFVVAGGTASPATTATALQMKKRYVYQPDTTGGGSATIYAAQDGIRHKLLGARGNLSLDLAVKAIPKFKFDFTAQPVDPTDTANPVPDFTAFQVPQAVNYDNTPVVSVFGFAAVMQALSLNLNNQVVVRNKPNAFSIDVVDSKPTGSITIEVPTIAQKDFWTLANNQTQGAITVTHGSNYGNKVTISLPQTRLAPPQYGDADGVMTLQANLIPLTTGAGDDDFYIIFE